jgi:predicted ATPase
LNLSWKRQTAKGVFFRAEDFSDFVNSVEREKQKIRNDLSELKGQVDDAIIEQLSQSHSMNYSLFRMRKDYGENMQAFSHGEAYLTRSGKRAWSGWLSGRPTTTGSPNASSMIPRATCGT